MFRARKYPLYTEEKGTSKQRLDLSLPNKMKTSEREALIAQKEKEIEEKQKSIKEDRGIADDENEDQAIRERVRERVIGNRERNVALENKREELEEGTSLRERVRNIFKKYGFTVSAVVLAVGRTIGMIVSALTRGQNLFPWKLGMVLRLLDAK